MDTATQQSLIEAAKLIIAAIIGSIVSPLVLSKVNRKRDESASHKTDAEALLIEADGAKKLVELSTGMLGPLYQQLNLISERLVKVECEKEELRVAYDKVLVELTERRLAEKKLHEEIIAIREENKNIREENARLRSLISTNYDPGQRSS